MGQGIAPAYAKASAGKPAYADGEDEGGKSGLHRAGRSLTARRGDPTESATETTQPYFAKAM